MRILPCALVICGLASAARADYAKAWNAAKDNLPATTRFVATLDVAAIVRLPAFGPLLETARKAGRELDETLTLLHKTCKLDPMKVVEGIVIAGDVENHKLAVFLQLSVDRAKASACLESMLKALSGNKPSSVRQEGIYTLGTVKRETAYFAWVAPNVVAFNVDIDNKQKLDAWIGQKTFARSPVAALYAKADPKAVAAGAYHLAKPLDRLVPVTSGYGQVLVGGATLTTLLLGITADATSASKAVTTLEGELRTELKSKRTSPSMQKVMARMTIRSKGNEITISHISTDQDLVDAVAAELKLKRAPVPEPMPTPPTP